MESSLSTSLKGKRGLVVGIANKSSIAAGCARAFVDAGADNRGDLPERQGAALCPPCRRTRLAASCCCPAMSKALASWRRCSTGSARSGANWIFYCMLSHLHPLTDLHGRVVDCSAAGFSMAMDVSCHSFLRAAHLAEPLMTKGGCLLTVTFYGSERVVANYNLMGPVKAALESAVRYTAAELGAKGIRANAISPGAIHTRAASGIAHFDEMLAAEAAAAPEHQLVDIEDVGALATFLVSDGARRITGTIIPVDGGQHAIA